MNRLERRFQELQAQGDRGLLCLVAMGDPDLETTCQLARVYVESGVDMVELALPTSHPRGDSSSLSAALQRAMAKGGDLDPYFETIRQIRQDWPTAPLEVAVSFEMLQAYGIQAFADKLVETDVDAVLVSDACRESPSAMEAFDKRLLAHGIHRIRFMPHPFGESLVPDMAANGRGFVILQAIARPDGSRPDVAPENGALINKLHTAGVTAPIALAYGIRTPDHIRKAVQLGADAVLIGTVLVEANVEGGARVVESVLRQLRPATRVM